MTFNLNRLDNFPTQHEEHKTPVTFDTLEAGFVASFIILVISFLIVIPGFRGNAGLFNFTRIMLSLIVGLSIMLGNFGQEWEVGHIVSKTPYKAGTGKEINAAIGIKLGLHSVNITLTREDKPAENDSLRNEIINYNERFSWAWDQGRFGFGRYAGQLQREFRRAQLQGLPLPILWIVDYFVIDGEGLRFGRYYRTAGWYAHIAMWAALPCWILANILAQRVVRYGSYFLGLSGVLQILACFLWVVIRNPIELKIPFDKEELTTHFGVNFWMTLAVGLFCLILSIVVLFLNLRFPDDVSVFFGIDPLTDFDEYHLTATELQNVRKKVVVPQISTSEIEMNDTQSTAEELNPENQTQVVLKRRGTVLKGQRAVFRTQVPLDDELPMYLNVPNRTVVDYAKSPEVY